MLKSEKSKPAKVFKPSGGKFECKANTAILLEGLTRTAVKALPRNPFQIERLPFLVGRKSRDPLAHNDLMIKDKRPYRISRHHMEIDKYVDEVFVLDRGSHLGTIVDGKQLGGSGNSQGPMTLKSTEGTIVLGDKDSPYRYKVICSL